MTMSSPAMLTAATLIVKVAAMGVITVNRLLRHPSLSAIAQGQCPRFLTKL